MGRFHVAVFGMRSENSTYSPFTTAFADFRPMTEEAELREHYLPVTTAGAGQRLDLAETQPPLERGFDDVDFSYIFNGRVRCPLFCPDGIPRMKLSPNPSPRSPPSRTSLLAP